MAVVSTRNCIGKLATNFENITMIIIIKTLPWQIYIYFAHLQTRWPRLASYEFQTFVTHAAYTELFFSFGTNVGDLFPDEEYRHRFANGWRSGLTVGEHLYPLFGRKESLIHVCLLIQDVESDNLPFNLSWNVTQLIAAVKSVLAIVTCGNGISGFSLQGFFLFTSAIPWLHWPGLSFFCSSIKLELGNTARNYL